MKKKNIFKDKNVVIIVVGFFSMIVIFLLLMTALSLANKNEKKILDSGTVISKEVQAGKDAEKKAEEEIFADNRPDNYRAAHVPLDRVPVSRISELETILEQSIDNNFYEQGIDVLSKYTKEGYEIPEELKEKAIIVDSMNEARSLLKKYFEVKHLSYEELYLEISWYAQSSPTPNVFVETIFSLPIQSQQRVYIHTDSYVMHSLMETTPTNSPKFYELINTTEIKDFGDSPYLRDMDFELQEKINAFYQTEFKYKDVSYYFDYFQTKDNKFHSLMVNLKNPEDVSHPDVLYVGQQVINYFQ